MRRGRSCVHASKTARNGLCTRIEHRFAVVSRIPGIAGARIHRGIRILTGVREPRFKGSWVGDRSARGAGGDAVDSSVGLASAGVEVQNRERRGRPPQPHRRGPMAQPEASPRPSDLFNPPRPASHGRASRRRTLRAKSFGFRPVFAHGREAVKAFSSDDTPWRGARRGSCSGSPAWGCSGSPNARTKRR